MKILEKKFDSLGFSFLQIHRENNYAIYERRYTNSEFKHYEVIKVQSHNGYEMNGTKYPPSEYYPSANNWGTMGWTCLTKEEAYSKLDKIIEVDKTNKSLKDKQKKNK